MGYLACDVCGACVMGEPLADIGDVGHVCCKRCEHAFPHVRAMMDEAKRTNDRLTDLGGDVREFLTRLAAQMVAGEGEIRVPRAEVEKLMARMRSSDGPMTRHLGLQCCRLGIVADAIGLFIARRRNRIGAETPMGRLRNLHERVKQYLEASRPEEDWPIDQTPEEVARSLA